MKNRTTTAVLGADCCLPAAAAAAAVIDRSNLFSHSSHSSLSLLSFELSTDSRADRRRMLCEHTGRESLPRSHVHATNIHTCLPVDRVFVCLTDPPAMAAFTYQVNRAIREIRGFVPFYKEANMAAGHIHDWMKLHLENDWGLKLKAIGVPARVLKCPELPFSGICFLALGLNCWRHAKYLQEMDTVHDVSMRLGVSTNTGALVPGTNSVITSSTDVSHLKYDDIFFLLKRKIDYTSLFVTEEYMPLVSDTYEHVIDPNAWYQDDEEGRQADSYLRWSHRHRLDGDWKTKRLALSAERPYELRFKQVSILKYEAPILRLRVEANGRFNAKSLAHLFNKVSDIDCCITACDRISLDP